jgi:hypothetical protein
MYKSKTEKLQLGHVMTNETADNSHGGQQLHQVANDVIKSQNSGHHLHRVVDDVINCHGGQQQTSTPKRTDGIKSSDWVRHKFLFLLIKHVSAFLLSVPKKLFVKNFYV